MVKLLLDAGANPNKAENEDEITPLHLAAEDGLTDVVTLLLMAGADPNQVNNLGETPLHGATNKHVVKVLLERGADPNVEDKKGNTPMYNAAIRGHHHVEQMMLEGHD